MCISNRCGIAAQLILLGLGTQAFAQTAAVPSQYQSLYSELQSSMQAVEPSLQPGVSGQTNFTFSGELLYANGNQGMALLRPTVRDSYLHELQMLKSTGMSGVVLEIGFPLLYQPFYSSTAAFTSPNPQNYDAMLAFWQQVIVDIHSQGMKAIVETEPLFPGYYTSGAGFNLPQYFSTFSQAQYEAARATHLVTIYSQVKPDYLDLGSEPDTEAFNSGQRGFLDPATWAAALASYIAAIPAGIHNPPLGAGVGNWRINDGVQFIQAEAALPGLDYIDVHAYPVVNEGSTNTFQFLLTLLQTAQAANKPVAMSEFWLLKIGSSTLTSNNAQDPTTASLNAYSFFAPLDQEFLTDMWKIGNQYKFLYGSAFWSRYFWSYVPYTPTAAAPGSALDALSVKVTGEALLTGQKDSTAATVQALTGASASAPVVLSSADFSVQLAVGSIATIFGTNLASVTAAAAGPLGTSLGGASVTVTDSTGASQPAQMLYASAGQINFIIPSGLAAGAGMVTITSDSGGAAQTSAVTLSTAAPGFFAVVGSNGVSLAAAQTVTNGSSNFQDTTNCTNGSCQPVSIDVSSGATNLVLYGTGIRGGSSSFSITFNQQPVNFQYAGVQPTLAGLDQVNVLIPASYAGAGVVHVQATENGIFSNSVEIYIQ